MRTGFRAQELCESRGGRPGLPVRNNYKPYGFCGRKATVEEDLVQFGVGGGVCGGWGRGSSG